MGFDLMHIVRPGQVSELLASGVPPMFNVPVLGPFIFSKSQFGHHLSQAGNAACLKKYFSVKFLVSHGLSTDSCYGREDPPQNSGYWTRGMGGLAHFFSGWEHSGQPPTELSFEMR